MKTQVVWIGGRIRSTFVVKQPSPFRPDLVLWLNVTRDQLLAADVIEPTQAQEILALRLRKALAEHAKALPTVVRVPDEGAAQAIRSFLPAGIRLEVAPVPELVAIARIMGEEIKPEESPGSYLEHG